MRFYVGYHTPFHADKFDSCMISINRLIRWKNGVLKVRKSDFYPNNWLMDSGAFTELLNFGRFRLSVEEYARQIKRWKRCGNLEAAAAQDYICDPLILAKTGLSVAEHQRLSVERYDDLLAEETGVYIIPTLQGQVPADYVKHLEMYGERIKAGAWVGVGSLVSKSGNAGKVKAILAAVKASRPDIRIHGFGLKGAALQDFRILKLLGSADSMAWSLIARKNGGDPNSWQEAKAFADEMNILINIPDVIPDKFPEQLNLF